MLEKVVYQGWFLHLHCLKQSEKMILQVKVLNGHHILCFLLKTNIFILADYNLAFSNRPPSLGHLVLVLNYLSTHLQECEKTLRDKCEKLSSVDVLSVSDLALFLPPNVAEKMSPSDRRSLAANKMRQEVARLYDDKKLTGRIEHFDLKYCSSHGLLFLGEAIEGGLYLLWTHLNKFLNSSLPKPSSESITHRNK